MLLRLAAINLTRWRYIGLALSCLLTLFCLIVLWSKGLHFGLDFRGGILLELDIQTLHTAAELNARLPPELASWVHLQAGGQNGEWLIRLPADGLQMAAPDLAHQLESQLTLPVQLVRTTQVGPQVGAELFQQGMLALFVAAMSISVYLAVRFEWRQAIGILLSVLHDAVVALGLLAWFQIEFDLNVIAGLMAVIGYSLNDSIVISDRLRDLLQGPHSQDIHACSDRAIIATFSRTLITSGSTLFTVGALLLFGGDALFGFSFTLFCGVLSGTWSSITIASTVQEMLGLSADAYKRKAEPAMESL